MVSMFDALKKAGLIDEQKMQELDKEREQEEQEEQEERDSAIAKKQAEREHFLAITGNLL